MTNTDILAEAIAEGVQPIVDKLKSLEARLAEVEGRGLKFCGIYQRASTYARGSVVTDGGSMWIALREVEGEQPGKSDGWQLAVKRGADGKDSR